MALRKHIHNASTTIHPLLRPTIQRGVKQRARKDKLAGDGCLHDTTKKTATPTIVRDTINKPFNLYPNKIYLAPGPDENLYLSKLSLCPKKKLNIPHPPHLTCGLLRRYLKNEQAP